MTTGQAQPVMRGTNPLDVADATANVATNQALDAALAANIDGKDTWPQSVTTQRINISEALTIGDQVTLTDDCIKSQHIDANQVNAEHIFATGLTATDISFSGTLSGFNITALGNISSGALAVGSGGVTIGTSGSGIYIGSNTITAVVGGQVKFSLNGSTGAAYFTGDVTCNRVTVTANASNSVNFGCTTTIGGTLNVNGNIYLEIGSTTRSIYLDGTSLNYVNYNLSTQKLNVTSNAGQVVLYGASGVHINSAATLTGAVGCTGNVSVTGNIAATGTVRIGSGAYLRSGAGNPAAGLGSTGDLYLSTGGSLHFRQLAGWKRIDNWVS